MNSGNHPALGSVGNWMFRNIGGINPGAPGFKKIVIKPLVDERIGYADVSYNCVYGLIRSAWKINGSRLRMKVEIPPNTTVEIFMTANNVNSVKQTGRRQTVTFLRWEAPWAVFAVGSGAYGFESNIPAHVQGR